MDRYSMPEHSPPEIHQSEAEFCHGCYIDPVGNAVNTQIRIAPAASILMSVLCRDSTLPG